MPTVLSANQGEGEDHLPLSALNDYLYCDRRFWLHYVAGLNADNAFTLLGRMEHDRVDESGHEQRFGVRAERAVPLVSRALRLTGRADVVEFHRQPDGTEVPFPIDYKHGPKRRWNNDDAQLCAQGMCLEEMLRASVPAGAIFHQKTKRRRDAPFTESLRSLVQKAAEGIHQLAKCNEPPAPVLKPQCDGCAMRRHCLPETAELNRRVDGYMSHLFTVEHPHE